MSRGGRKRCTGARENLKLIDILEVEVGGFLRVSLEVEDCDGKKWCNNGREQTGL